MWEKEYRNPTFLTKEMEPQADTVRFFKFLKKEQKFSPMSNMGEAKRLIDLGCGTGRNSFYATELGLNVCGIDISKTAINEGITYAQEKNIRVELRVGSIGEKLAYSNETFDLALDVTSSNSLSEAEREIYFEEMYRVLKPGGYVYIKALCKDGDANAKELLRRFPGSEADTYILPEQKIIERVWMKKDITDFYSRKFKILHLEMKESYTTMGDRKYKRRFWIMYLQKS